jgi:hypothetical protein
MSLPVTHLSPEKNPAASYDKQITAVLVIRPLNDFSAKEAKSGIVSRPLQRQMDQFPTCWKSSVLRAWQGFVSFICRTADTAAATTQPGSISRRP